MNIEELRAEKSRLMRLLDSVNTELHNKILEEQGIEMGMLVQNSKGRIYRVDSASSYEFSKAWLTGNPKLKNGTFGKLSYHLFSDWEKI